MNFALTLNNLAVVFMENGENARAEPLLLESLSVIGKLLSKHPEYMNTKFNLAALYGNLGV